MKQKIFRTIPSFNCLQVAISVTQRYICEMGPVHCKLASQQHINFLFLSDNIILF